MKDKILKWLDEQGYSFEMRVAERVRRGRLSVVQSEFYLDPETKRYRETDVVAYHSEKAGDWHFIVAVVFECKVSLDKPWVLMSQCTELTPGDSVKCRAYTWYSQSLLSRLSDNEQVQTLAMLELPRRTGYSLVVSLSKNENDRAYSALMSVASATKAIIDRISKDDTRHKLHVFAVPVIVVKGKLYESYLSSDKGLVLEEISQGTLAWRNPVLAPDLVRRVPPVSLVTLITEKALDGYVATVSREVKTFAQLGADRLLKGVP